MLCLFYLCVPVQTTFPLFPILAIVMTNNVRPLSVNRLLASLPRSEHKRLALDLKPVELMFSEILYESGDRIEYVYFPSNSIISLLSTMSERSTLEVGMVGNEGIAGLSVFMGVDTSANRAIVQGTGSALRLSSSAIRREANRLGSLHRLLHRYTTRSCCRSLSLPSAIDFIPSTHV